MDFFIRRGKKRKVRVKKDWIKKVERFERRKCPPTTPLARGARKKKKKLDAEFRGRRRPFFFFLLAMALPCCLAHAPYGPKMHANARLARVLQFHAEKERLWTARVARARSKR